MIARRDLPEEFTAWNEKYGAPNGRRLLKQQWMKRLLPWRLYQRHAGPFSLQVNNTTRRQEYPWAFYSTPITPGLKVLEIGGGLAGFQFVLDACGCRVVNVDPGMEADIGWPCDAATMAKLNRVFGTSVELRNTIVEKAHLETQSFDRAFSISVVEHLSDVQALKVMKTVFDCLKPGGYFVLTVDLFLNLVPFTTRKSNKYGTNADIKRLVESAPFNLAQGDPAELYGYPDFDPDRIQSNLEAFFIGGYPTLIQCLVLQKPAHAGAD